MDEKLLEMQKQTKLLAAINANLLAIASFLDPKKAVKS